MLEERLKHRNGQTFEVVLQRLAVAEAQSVIRVFGFTRRVVAPTPMGAGGGQGVRLIPVPVREFFEKGPGGFREKGQRFQEPAPVDVEQRLENLLSPGHRAEGPGLTFADQQAAPVGHAGRGQAQQQVLQPDCEKIFGLDAGITHLDTALDREPG